MDTRAKIIPFENIAEATAAGRWIVITGTFDPLTSNNATYVSRLAEEHVGHQVLALVEPAPAAHLPAEARAALVAALRRIDCVAIGSAVRLPASLSHAPIFTDSDRDLQHSRSFIELVLQRQKAEGQ